MKKKTPIKRPSHYIIQLVQSELMEVLSQMDKSLINYQQATDILNKALLSKGISRETYQFCKESIYKIRNGRILGRFTGREPTKMDRIGKICAPQSPSDIKPRDLSKEEIEEIIQAWVKYGTGSTVFLRDHPQYQFLTRQALEHWKRDTPRFAHLFRRKNVIM